MVQREIWNDAFNTWYILIDFQVIYFGVFQYCFVRVFMTIVAVITEATGRYCLESLNPVFAHVWVSAEDRTPADVARADHF